VTAGNALDAVRAFPERVLHEIFVIDRAHTLIGSIPLRVLIAAPAAERLGALAVPVAASFVALSNASTVLASPAWTDTHTVPVVDGSGLFLGALRYDAVLRLAAGDAPARMSTASVSTLLGLSELCWAGCAGLFAELTAAVIRSRHATGEPHGA
jgi:Mg/Co/Ni transporter MgtE